MKNGTFLFLSYEDVKYKLVIFWLIMQWIEHGAELSFPKLSELVKSPLSHPLTQFSQTLFDLKGFFIGMCFLTAFSYAIFNKLNGNLFKNTLKQKSKVN